MCFVFAVCSRGCGLKARGAAAIDAEGVADGETQATVEHPGRLGKLHTTPQSETGLQQRANNCCPQHRGVDTH